MRIDAPQSSVSFLSCHSSIGIPRAYHRTQKPRLTGRSVKRTADQVRRYFNSEVGPEGELSRALLPDELFGISVRALLFQVALRLQVLRNSFSNGLRSTGLRLRTISDPCIKAVELTWRDPNCDRSGIDARAAAFVFAGF